MSEDKLKDLAGLPDKLKKNLESLTSDERMNYNGVAGNKLVEPVPNYISTPSESVIQNDHNAWVVLGRDRPANRFSGYSGKGATGAGSVDIVAGRGGSEALKAEDDDGEPQYIDPDFKRDAARVHVSQKTDIDDNFDLAEGNVGKSTGKSGIGVKADGVRVVGREGVKIVTGTDEQNSKGGDASSVKGIDLIAGNDDSDLQPLVKGDNLQEALETLIENQKTMAGILENFLTAQMQFNSSMAGHIHPAPGVPSPVAVAAGAGSTISELLNSFLSSPIHRTNMEMFKMKYCKPMGDKYIKSRHNHTT